MAEATLRPSADGTTTGWSVTGGTGSHASAIVDDPDSNDGDTSYVLSPNVVDGTMFVELDDVPADFDPGAINSITIKVAHRRLNTPNMAVDLGTVNAFLTRADESTAISTTPTPVDSPIQAGYELTSFTPSPTGTHTVAEWNGARLALVFDHTNSQAADSVNQIRITAAEVVIDYTPQSSEPYNADLSAPTFGFSAQGLTRLNSYAATLTASAFAFAAQSVTRLNDWIGQATAPAFTFTGQSVSWSGLASYVAELTTASFAMTGQAITRLNAWRGDLSSAGFAIAAQTLNRFSAWFGELSSAAFAIAGQPVSFSGIANFVADLTAASFAMSGQALTRFSAYKAQLTTASLGLAVQALAWTQDTVIQLGAASLQFAGQALSYIVGGAVQAFKRMRGFMANVGRMMNR